MRVVIELLLGMISAVVFVVIMRQVSARREMRIMAVALVAAALIYVGFAARGAPLSWIVLELGGLAIFTLIAFLGLRISAWILALGWAAHAVWDGALHTFAGAAFVPRWYPMVCAGFDLFLAGYIAVRAKKNSLTRTT